MNGKLIVGILLGIAIAIGIGLWYSQNNAYYVEVNGLTGVEVSGELLDVSDYHGIDAESSPLKMRACFSTRWDIVPTFEYQEVAEPLVAPGWFDCFNAERLYKDIRAGEATAIMADDNNPFGFSRFVALYPDGQAFMWRQMNSCGRAMFAGDDLPDGCIEAKVTAKGMQRAFPADLDFLLEPESSVRLVPIIGSKPERVWLFDFDFQGNSRDVFSQHGCFSLSMSFGLLTETFELAEPATPQDISGGLPCFDAERLTTDLEIGHALAFWGEKNLIPGVDRVVAVYDDGRAYVWHQKNENYVE